MMAKTVSETVQVARKNHYCEECGCCIVKGHTYSKSFITEGGDAWTFKSHVDCLEMADKYRAENKLWGFDWHPLFDLFDHGNEPPKWRGMFPHVVCRMEFHMSYWETQ